MREEGEERKGGGRKRGKEDKKGEGEKEKKEMIEGLS